MDFTRSRNTIIAALILVCALGFNGLGGITFDVLGASVTLSGLAIASIVGIAANAILPGKTTSSRHIKCDVASVYTTNRRQNAGGRDCNKILPKTYVIMQFFLLGNNLRRQLKLAVID